MVIERRRYRVIKLEFRRWFHHNLEGIQAEKLLLEKGDPGSFLVRPSWTNPGNFTLSVRREDCVTHIRIRNTGDFLDLYGGETFATLSELVDYYRENHGELKEKNGSIIELKYPLFCQDPLAESSRWFHGPMSRNEAQKLLLEKGKNGSFLVRESIQKPGSYVLSVATGDQVSHILINRKKDNKFDAGGGHQFSTLKELIDFYTATPMVEKNGGLVYLKQPFNATRLNVSTIDKRIRQLECENVNGRHLAGFHEEFEELHQDIHDTKARSRLEGAKAYNLDKNRYKNILPFDSTLVRLIDGDPNIPGSDYINANYISWPDSLTESLLGGSTTVDPLPPKTARGSPAPLLSSSSSSSSGPRYIATQGTLPNTIVDFWRMVWQEHSAIIVMITKEVERGRNKCSRYWPTPTQPTLELPSYGGTLLVRHLAEQNLETYILRELHLSRNPPAANSGSGKTYSVSGDVKSFVVYHYQFHAWPDHGTPADPSCVLNFMFDISKRVESLAECGPMVVHCSAGIGRSGTFIVIDMLINYIKRYGLQCDIDISRTVQAVREQRSGMVQIETQYRFIYKAVQNFVSTLSQRLQLHNELQPLGVDYTNINQAPADLMQTQRPDSASPVDRRLASTSPRLANNGSFSRKSDLCVTPSYVKSICANAEH
ncbi:Tyrosine-protein phosphatase non-receptor type 11 [Taenia crassiceps]|uniref:Tyrosine-protein phosphatase non-receptor type 11 n=1 Tax=Taenia crassiceps TaxID=6207 RepID=A0ABR4QF81_9CEST